MLLLFLTTKPSRFLDIDGRHLERTHDLIFDDQGSGYELIVNSECRAIRHPPLIKLGDRCRSIQRDPQASFLAEEEECLGLEDDRVAYHHTNDLIGALACPH